MAKHLLAPADHTLISVPRRFIFQVIAILRDKWGQQYLFDVDTDTAIFPDNGRVTFALLNGRPVSLWDYRVMRERAEGVYAAVAFLHDQTK